MNQDFGESRGLVFRQYEVEESEAEAFFDRTQRYHLPYGGRMGARKGIYVRGRGSQEKMNRYYI